MTATIRVAIQQQERLFRQGLDLLLGAETGVKIVGIGVTPEDLVALCERERPDVAVLEVPPEGRDVHRLPATLRRRHRFMRLVGLSAALSPRTAERARGAGVDALVARQMGVTALLRAVRAQDEEPVPAAFMTASRVAGEDLTSREIDVLKLIGTGRTTHQISGELEISPKTVENHKQRTFRKLGVQNQAHAVALALRRGILLPGAVIDLTAQGADAPSVTLVRG